MKDGRRKKQETGGPIERSRRKKAARLNGMKMRKERKTEG